MSVLVVVLLGGVWALILLPGPLQARRLGSPLNSIDAFEQSMSRLAPPRTPPGGHVVVLGRPGPDGLRQPTPMPGRAPQPRPPQPRVARATGPPPPSPQTLERRRQVLATLAGATALTGVLGLLVGGMMWVLFVLAYAALSAYVALLVQIRSRREEAREKLHYLAPQPAVAPLTSGVRIRTARGA